MPIKPRLRRIAWPSNTHNHTHSTPPLQICHSQTFQLPNGRVLGFAEYGNPNGSPLLYFHGFPSSRIEAEPADATARRYLFVVTSLSGGGPFALACAHALPKNMVAGVGLFASGGPWEAGTHHMSRIRRLTLRGLRAIATSGTIVRRVDAWLEAQYAGKERKETEETEWVAPIKDDNSNQ
uniref:Proline iminopeptidase n=1 Tax=Talaromyces marneffei PM1 TaxID=1077442 RepID=A0A093VK70_TALMA